MVVPTPIPKADVATARPPVRRHAKSTATDNDPAHNPVELVLRLLRGRWRMTCVAAAVLGVLGATVGYLARRPKFESMGMIQASANRPGIMYENLDHSRLRLFDTFVSAEVAHLTSRPVLERALADNGLAEIGWSPTADSFQHLLESTNVKAKDGLITVVCSSTIAEEAAAMVNALLDAYAEMHVEYLRREDSVRERQLVRREAELLEKLQHLETRIKEVGQEYGVQSIAAAHVRKIAQIEDVDLRVAELATTVASREATDALSEVDTGDGEIKRLVILDHALADMLFERTKRAAKLASLPNDLADSHPAVRQAVKALASIDGAIEDRRAQLATLGTTGALTKTGKNAEEESLQGLRTLQNRLESRVVQLRREAKELNARFIELEFLDSEREQVRELLDETRQVLEQVRVESQNTLPGTVEIRARGNISAKPASDKRKLLAAVGAAGGAGTGVAAVMLACLLAGRIRFSDDLSATFPNPGRDVSLSGVLPACTNTSDESFSQSVHRLRNELQLTNRQGRHSQLIVVTGSRLGCGVTHAAKALAESYAETRTSTVLVDADLLTSSLSIELGLAGRDGLKEAIQHDRLNGECCQLTENLTAVPTGHSLRVKDHQVSFDALAPFFGRLRKQFQVVIVDTGSFEEHLLAQLACAQADDVLLVVPRNETHGRTRRILEALSSIGGSLHAVLNFTHENDPRNFRPAT